MFVKLLFSELFLSLSLDFFQFRIFDSLILLSLFWFPFRLRLPCNASDNANFALYFIVLVRRRCCYTSDKSQVSVLYISYKINGATMPQIAAQPFSEEFLWKWTTNVCGERRKNPGPFLANCEQISKRVKQAINQEKYCNLIDFFFLFLRSILVRNGVLIIWVRVRQPRKSYWWSRFFNPRLASWIFVALQVKPN